MRIIDLKDNLSKDVKEVSTKDLVETFKICQDLETLCLKENGIGLSAIQVGIPLKLFVVRLKRKNKFEISENFGYFINIDYYTTCLNYIISLEKCLSIRSPNGQLRHFQVNRYPKIMINGYKLDYTRDLTLSNLQDVELTVDDQSLIFAQMVDHQRNISLSDIGKEVFLW